MNVARKIFLYQPIVLMLMLPALTKAQCPEVFDFYGNVVDNPYWYECSGGDFNFNLQSPDDWNDYEIDWGDGSPVESGGIWSSPDIINHIYSAALDTFIVTITEPSSGCSIEGVVVMEEFSSASIQIPIGGMTATCAPKTLEFINASTNVSQTTIFTWDFGDDSPSQVYDYTNWGQTVQHLYEIGSVDCQTEVTLTAENYCNIVQGSPSQNIYTPILIWDIDQAAISASSTTLCYPDTIVSLTNTSEKNCSLQGNIFQRHEYWNFGDYWGEGQDSIIDWSPWPPAFPQTIGYPGIGVYEVQLLDSNYCGIDTSTIQINIVPPPIADISQSEDTICVGEPITFFQNTTGDADTYSWNFDDGIGWLPTGYGNITYVFNQPGDYNVCSAVSIQNSSGACADTSCVTVTVLAGPVADLVADVITGCDSLTVDYSDNSTGANSWEWTFDVTPFDYTGTNPTPINYTAPGNYVTTLTVESLNGCLDTDQEVISVVNSPVPDMIANNVCENDTASFLDLSTSDPGDPILSWLWDFGDNETSNLQHPSHIYVGQGTFDVTLTTNTAICSSTAIFQVTVEPAPSASISLENNNGCSPLTVNFSNNSSGSNSYAWNFGDGNGSIEEEPTNTFYNFTSSDTTYQVVMAASTSFGCGANDSLEVTVFPGAQASFIDNSLPPSCSPFNANFVNMSLGASNYLWDFGDGSPTSTDEHPSHYYENETGFIQTFDVTLIAYSPTGCNDTIQSGITVYPAPEFEFTVWPDSGCSPLTVTMPFVTGINQYEWDFGDGSELNAFPQPTHIFENPTNDPIIYDIQLVGISPFGCIDTTYSQIVVTPQPTSQFMTNIGQGCSPLTVEFENISLQADSYTWSYGDGDTAYTSDPFHSHEFINTTNTIVTYDVILTATSNGGCEDQFTVPIQVFPQVIAGFEDPGNDCSPYSIELNNTTLNGENYTWEFGNGLQSIDENPSTIYVNSIGVDTTYNICIIATSGLGCTDDFCLPVTVYPSPIADFTMSANESCAPTPINFENQSTLADSYEWIYGDGNNAFIDDPIHTHTYQSTSDQPEEFAVSLVLLNSTGCTDTLTSPVTIYPAVTAGFVVDGAGCSPVSASFENQSTGASSGYEWDFGDGGSTSQENPAHIYVNNTGADTTYYADLIATSIYGCSDTTTVGINVYPTPIANAGIDTIMGCYPLDVVFQNTSIGADEYTWVYGTGQISDTTAETHTYTFYNFGDQPVTYDISLITTTEEGCESVDYLTIDVPPELEAEFTAPDEECSPFEVDFTNESIGALSYWWEFGDGDTHTIANPTHTYHNDGLTDTTYTAMMVAQSFYGCFDTTYHDITVFATPFANFIAQPESQVWPNATITLTDLSVAGAVTYEWDMDDGNELDGETPDDYTYDDWGVYDIDLFITNGSCSSEATSSIEITPPVPIADFIIDTVGCAPMTVHFKSNSQFALSYHWDFGDGGEAQVENPVYGYNFPGTYNVTLTVQGYNEGQEDSYTIESAIEVLPPATAIFTVSPNEVFVPGQPVLGINLSQNATEYEWQFGDGGESNEENPTHFYQTEGWFNVTLVALNDWNCPDTLTIVDAVHAIALGKLEFPNAFTPNSAGPNGGVYDPMAFDNDIFFPLNYGVLEFQMQIFNKWGELLFESNEINIGWDGYYKDKLCKEDVYAWKARARFSDGQEIQKAGDVTLLVK